MYKTLLLVVFEKSFLCVFLHPFPGIEYIVVDASKTWQLVEQNLEKNKGRYIRTFLRLE